jgi:hypothetical protein
MPSPNATPTPITPPRVPLIDPRTGLIDRAWYLFFLSLNNIATGVIDDSGLTFSSESLIASYDAALQALAQEVETQPPPVDLSAELIKQIEAAGLIDCCSGLLSQVAEMQKQLEALNLLPPPSQGTVTTVTATAPVVSSGGTAPDISMPAASTSVNGYLTSTDWNTFNSKAPATSGTSILYGNGSGGFSNVTIGSGVSFAAGTLSATGSGGTVTSVGLSLPTQFTVTNSPVTGSGTLTGSWNNQTANYVLAGPTTGAAAAPTFRALVSADIPSLSYVTSVTGTAPVVSSGGLTPAISMAAASASANGYLTSTDWTTFNNKGSGTVTSVSGTAGRITSTGGTTPVIDLASGVATPGTTGSSTLVPVITIDTYGRVTSITTAANPQGTVTSVTGTAPVVSSGGATPAISMAAATSSVNGYLTSTDWSTFNGKQAALVSGTNIKTVNGTTLLGSGDVGTIVPSYGGTGVTTLSGIAYGNGTAAFTAATAAQVVSVIGSTAVTNATNATNVGITQDTTSSVGYITWSPTNSGNNALKTSSGTLYWNPSSNSFYATNHIGTSAAMQGNGAIYTVQWLADGGSAEINFKKSDGTSLWTIGGGVTIQQDELSFRHQGTVVLYLQNNAAVKFPNISTTASAANAFLDSGNSNNLLRSTSSVRYKTAIEDIGESYSANIFKLRPIWYRSLAEADNPDWSWYGLLAEDVAKVEPRLVHWSYMPEDLEEIKVQVQSVNQDKDGNLTQTTQEETRQVPKAGVEKKPDGVQYERLAVLMLAELTKLREEFDAYKASHP